MAMNRSLIDRLADKFVFSPSGCWDWTANKQRTGYGHITIDKKACLAHRVMYEFLIGPIPDGLTLDHLCRNTSCVNPKHLEPVTLRENLLRGNGFGGVNARKTHCARGHEYSEANTRIRNGTWRFCRACDAEDHRERRRRVSYDRHAGTV